MTSARAVLTNRVPGRNASRFFAVMMPRVESSNGICTLTTSEFEIDSFMSSTGVTFRFSNTCAGTWEFHADTFMPKALAMPATVCPMPPSPMMPSFLPNSSKPSAPSQSPCLTCISSARRAWSVP